MPIILYEGLGRNSVLDSLDWSRKYEVLSISRPSLSSLGLTAEQITTLTDEDMQRIAAILVAHYYGSDTIYMAARSEGN